jgi:GxxExxY protein
VNVNPHITKKRGVNRRSDNLATIVHDSRVRVSGGALDRRSGDQELLGISHERAHGLSFRCCFVHQVNCSGSADSSMFHSPCAKSGGDQNGVDCAPCSGMTSHVEVEGLTEKIIGCAIEVHRNLGPGLLESVYRECMIVELQARSLRVESERQVPLEYKGRRIRGSLKMDLVVENCVVVELKAVDRLHSVHLAQVITYLKLTGFPAGLLMNFHTITLTAGLKRLHHPDRYVKKSPDPADPAS